MAKPNIKLAESLEILKDLQKSNGNAIRFDSLTRTHRERLVKNNFLTRVTKEWYTIIDPKSKAGDTTTWYTSFWDFCKNYLENKYNQNYCLSAEQSLLLQAGNTAIPHQLIVQSPNAPNKTIELLHGTSMYILKSKIKYESEIDETTNLRIQTKEESLINIPPILFEQNPLEVRIVLAAITDPTALLRKLLERSHSVKAGRLIGAFENIGNKETATQIKKTMKAADFKIHVTDPFSSDKPKTLIIRNPSLYVNRINLMWESMRPIVSDLTPLIKEKKNKNEYLKQVDEIYTTDAYHSLSIENYVVSAELIEKVKSGNWDPNQEEDNSYKNALAARGYWLCFQEVKKSVAKLFDNRNPGKVFESDHSDWYIQLFQPSVATGILNVADIAGYRNSQVYIKNSKYIPLNKTAVRDAITTLFHLLQSEENAFVRSVLGHFIFVYIHPYMDGNGRMGRFLMNLMLASGGYPWTVIPIKRRKDYMLALEYASVKRDIKHFAILLSELVQKNLDGNPEAEVIESL